MKFKSLSLFLIFILAAFILSCQTDKSKESKVADSEKLQIRLEKTISLDISGGIPKLQGNPFFFSDKNGSYFFIQNQKGIGTFDLAKGGNPISILKLEEIENFRGNTSTDQNQFIPYSKDGFIYFDRRNDEIYLLENSRIIASQKLSRLFENEPKPLSGFLKSAVKTEKLVTALNMAEKYGGPPYTYGALANTIGIFDQDLREFQSTLPLPDKYLGKRVNIYDLLITMDYNQNTKEYIINFPILDSLIFTKDFKYYNKISASPKKNFVNLEKRTGENVGEWSKEYYTENTFFTVYYDPYRDLYIRHYREAISESEFESLKSNSFKMLDSKNKNYLLFLDRNGKQIHTMDVSEFNHLYVHFGKEGMYILNDIELENEDSLTFSLFTIERK